MIMMEIDLQQINQIFFLQYLLLTLQCSSHYQLVSTFPKLYFKRSDARMIFPYRIEFVSVDRIYKFLDSVSLIENPYHELKFQIGNEEEEIVYCIGFLDLIWRIFKKFLIKQ
ncbi:unnamed protein product [Paramecium octaurelia]|uniref:Uncharacterized protein n=1 Tax=Paramecium octaurelia TaxID=43137 RepID=A0A8S1YD14_PAROT|nr:unnamed protein product [Paramecium octaurelia]